MTVLDSSILEDQWQPTFSNINRLPRSQFCSCAQAHMRRGRVNGLTAADSLNDHSALTLAPLCKRSQNLSFSRYRTCVLAQQYTHARTHAHTHTSPLYTCLYVRMERPYSVRINETGFAVAQARSLALDESSIEKCAKAVKYERAIAEDFVSVLRLFSDKH